MRRTAAVVSAISIVGALALGGVAAAGGGKPLTKKQFIKQADKICTVGNKATNALGEQYFGDLGKNEQPDAATVEAFWGEAEPILTNQIDDIRALLPPKADRQQVKKILAAVDAAIEQVSADPQAALTSGNAFAKADKLAQKYGLKVCGADN